MIFKNDFPGSLYKIYSVVQNISALYFLNDFFSYKMKKNTKKVPYIIF